MRMKPNSLWSKAAVTLGLLWFVAVILAYYAVHKPVSGSQIDGAEGAGCDGGRMGKCLISWPT